jgi:hypothetical protein
MSDEQPEISETMFRRNVWRDLARLEGEQKGIKDQVISIYQGETFFFKKIQWFGTIVIAVLAVGGIFNYVVNTNKLDEAVRIADKKIADAADNLNVRFSNVSEGSEKELKSISDRADKRLDDISGKTKVKAMTVTNLLNETDVLFMDLHVQPNRVLNDLIDFKEEITFRLIVGTSGPGVADFRGFIVRTDGDMIKLLSMHPYGPELGYIEKFRSGTAFYSDASQDIIASAPLETNFSISKTVTSCEDVDNDFHKLMNNRNLGDIFVEPIVANIETRSVAQKFRIITGQNTSLYSCAELLRKSSADPKNGQTSNSGRAAH